MICGISLPKQVKFGDVHHDHIWHMLEFSAWIRDVRGQAGGVVPYPPLVVIIIAALHFHICMLPISQDAFRIQPDRTPLQVFKVPLWRDIYLPPSPERRCHRWGLSVSPLPVFLLRCSICLSLLILIFLHNKYGEIDSFFYYTHKFISAQYRYVEKYFFCASILRL